MKQKVLPEKDTTKEIRKLPILKSNSAPPSNVAENSTWLNTKTKKSYKLGQPEQPKTERQKVCDEILEKFKNHYWDSYNLERETILKHVGWIIQQIRDK